MKQPKPSQVKQLRELAGLSRDQAAALVHATYRTWQNWELEDSAEARDIPLASWELFLLKLAELEGPASKAALELLPRKKG